MPKMSMTDFIDLSTKKEIWAIEDSASSLVGAFNLDGHSDYQLDRIGSLIGCKRLGLSDSYYRKKIRAFAIQQNSFGNHNSVVQIVKLVTNATNVTLENMGNASIQITIDTGWTTWAVENIRMFVESALAAGVQLLSIMHSGTALSFEFSDTSITTDTVQGFGDRNNSSVGGMFNYIIA